MVYRPPLRLPVVITVLIILRKFVSEICVGKVRLFEVELHPDLLVVSSLLLALWIQAYSMIIRASLVIPFNFWIVMSFINFLIVLSLIVPPDLQWALDSLWDKVSLDQVIVYPSLDALWRALDELRGFQALEAVRSRNLGTIKPFLATLLLAGSNTFDSLCAFLELNVGLLYFFI